MTAATCCEVPTVGWINLKRTHARCHYSGAMTGDQLVVGCISWFGCEANEPPKCWRYTAAARLELSTIRATDEPGTYDARASICTGISSKLHCSAVSLEPMPLVSSIPSSSYTTYRSTPLPLYYLPPPSYYSYYLLLLTLSYFFNFSYRLLLPSVSSASITLINLTYISLS